MRHKFLLLLATADALLSLAISARADTFTLITNGKVDKFMLPASPEISTSYDFGFSIASVPINEGGTDLVRQIDFFDAATGGGLLIKSADGPDFNGLGNVLYTGSNAQPTFLLGTFALTGINSGVLTITDPVAAPEPLPAILIAIGLLGVACVRRRNVRASG